MKFKFRPLTCSFLCYKDPHDTDIYSVKQYLSDLISYLVSFNNVRVFYFTGDNMIDRMAYELVSHFKLHYSDIQRIYVHTRPWNDTTSNYSREFINEGFEKVIGLKPYAHHDEQFSRLKRLVDASCFVFYYVKLEKQLTFINFKRELCKNTTYRYLLKTMPKSTINLIDFDVVHYFQVKEVLDLINKKPARKVEDIFSNFLIIKDNFYNCCINKQKEYKHNSREARRVRNCSYPYKKRKKKETN